MAKEKFEAGVAGTKPVVDKDLNQDGVVDMNEELVAAQAAVESGDVVVAPEVIEALEPVVTEPTVTAHEQVENQPEVVQEAEKQEETQSSEAPKDVVEEAEKQEETQSSEAPKDVVEEQPKEVIKASQVVKNNAGSSVQFNLPEVRVVKNNSSFVM